MTRRDETIGEQIARQTGFGHGKHAKPWKGDEYALPHLKAAYARGYDAGQDRFQEYGT